MSNRPVHEIRLGHIKAVIWANETDAGIRHNVSLVRIYRDGEKWATSETFGRDDLPLVSKVADLAHTWIYVETQNGISRSATEDREDRAKQAGSRK